MTEEQWKKAETMLTPPYGFAKLTADGYDISIVCQKDKGLKYYLMIYVNGKFRLEWLDNDCEIRRRFCRSSKRQLLTGKEKDEYIKHFGKRAYNEMLKNGELNYIAYTPCFNSFRTLKAHLIKNNKSIEFAE